MSRRTIRDQRRSGATQSIAKGSILLGFVWWWAAAAIYTVLIFDYDGKLWGALPGSPEVLPGVLVCCGLVFIMAGILWGESLGPEERQLRLNREERVLRSAAKADGSCAEKS